MRDSEETTPSRECSVTAGRAEGRSGSLSGGRGAGQSGGFLGAHFSPGEKLRALPDRPGPPRELDPHFLDRSDLDG